MATTTPNSSENNTSSAQAPNNLDIIKNSLGLTHLNHYITEILSYAKNNFEKFSAMLAILTTIGLWTFKSFGYFYQIGKFLPYHIDKCYVNINNNFFFQIVQSFAIIIFFLLVNFIFIDVLTQNDQSRFHYKKIGNILLLMIFEIVILFIFVSYKSNLNLVATLKEIKGYSFVQTLIFLILLLILFAIFNSLGISILVSNRKQVSSTDSNAPLSLSAAFKTFLIAAIIVLPFLFAFTYYLGIQEEKVRTDFKVITEEITYPADISNENYIFTDSENQTAHIFYPIVFENEDIYILCRLYQDSNSCKLDTSFQKVIEKNNVNSIYIDNIYKFAPTVKQLASH